MSDLMAAIGRVQLANFNYHKKSRQDLAKKYFELVKSIPSVSAFNHNYDEVVPHIFVVKIAENIDRKKLIENHDYLSPQQEKMMATQPDMILQYAHHISKIYKDSILTLSNGKEIKFGPNPKVTADIKVALFNKGSRSFIDEKVNLSEQKRGFLHKKWILPYEN